MPRKRSNLNNSRSIGAKRQQNERNNRMHAQTGQINEEHRISAVETKEESQAHRNERLRQNALRSRAAPQTNIDSIRAQQRQRQQTSRALTRASFVRLAFEYAPDIDYS